MQGYFEWSHRTILFHWKTKFHLSLEILSFHWNIAKKRRKGTILECLCCLELVSGGFAVLSCSASSP